MISYDYKKDSWPSFSEGIRREWVLTNGIGGYAGSSLIGAHNRTHQGYLIASLHPPIERYLVFSKINETIVCGAEVFSLETAQHLDPDSGQTVYKEGQKYLAAFRYDGSVHSDYQAGNIRLTRHVSLKKGKNLCAVAYEIANNGPSAELILTPLFNFREHSESSSLKQLAFHTKQVNGMLILTPEIKPDVRICFSVSEGAFCPNEILFDENMQLQTEVELETDGLDNHYCPVRIKISLPAQSVKQVSVLCETLLCDSHGSPVLPPPCTRRDAFTILAENEAYVSRLYRQAGYKDDFANRLVLAADQFLCFRKSTGLKTVLAGLPWFTDWGRDTMIAFTGLTLCTGRFKEAEEILLTFSRYIRHGIVPNMFPDDNAEPLYNTADASLWYFYAVYEYLTYNPSETAYAFIRDHIYPHLKEIINAYQNGTYFNIYMEEDGLIHAGSGLDQITWMDVRVGDWVATPRHGKPVEINALWYNALKVTELLAERFNEDSHPYRIAAERTKTAFCREFWNEELGCLFDVADGGGEKALIRPNQIYAVSLPFTMLSKEQEASVVSVVEKELYVGVGLRSLSAGHPDYHGIYCGSLPKRDAAYHQGTAWGFLLGGFISAYVKVHGRTEESIQAAKELLKPIYLHLFNGGCIGSVSEIFDGDTPHHPRGCYAQAWSVGEVLRCYAQDILDR